VNGSFRGRSPARERLVPEVVATLRHLEALGHERPMLLAYHPVARVNPYQALLYRETWQHGIAPLPLYHLDQLDDVHTISRAAGVPLVLHLHWTSSVLWKAASDAEAELAVEAFLDRLDRFRADGGQLVWTVHNVLPHDAQRPELEARLQQGIVDRSTVVHVLTGTTTDAVRDWFTLPEDRLVHVPHQSYAGAYPDAIGREDARWQLGLDPDEVVYVMLGAIKPYKGSERLLDALDRLRVEDPRRRRLVIAGQPDRTGALDAFLDRCELHPNVLLHARTIPAEDMQLFLRAADVAVLPYHRSLNSGVLMLALTFGVPVVAPAVGGIAELVTSAFGRLFEPGSDASLGEALLAADALLTPEAREAARRAAADLHPARVSAEFAQAVRERVLAAAQVPA
jgi:beta-1,4-mannosyltransferase